MIIVAGLSWIMLKTGCCSKIIIGESLSIDETCLSSGEVYTFLTNKAGKGRNGTLVAVVKGTKAEDVI